MLSKITPCIWFNNQAEEAAHLYVSIFPNSKINSVTRFPDAGQEIHGKPAGSVMTVEFELEGQSFTALNGGPMFTLSEAMSLQVDCADQAEVDYYWDKLGEGGDPSAQQCGWLKDKFGLSWQIVPHGFAEMMTDPDPEKIKRAFTAMLEMHKLDIAALRQAFEGR